MSSLKQAIQEHKASLARTIRIGSRSQNQTSDDDSEYLSDDDLGYDDSSDEDDEETSLLSLPNDDIVFADLLAHRSFYDTAKKRRKRHVLNRFKGNPPTLHFNGTRETHFWKGYGVKPDEVLPVGSIRGVNTMFTEEDFKLLGPFERRLHVNGQKFKVVHNHSTTHTLYRSIAHALRMTEENDFLTIRKVIFTEMEERWPMFANAIYQYCIVDDDKDEAPNHLRKLQLKKPKTVLEIYKKHVKNLQPTPELELTAAAMHYGFNYSIMDLEKLEMPITVNNCSDHVVVRDGTVTYHFLRSGNGVGSDLKICYEFLLPIGPLTEIPDGRYPAKLRDVLLIERCRSLHSHKPTAAENQLNRPSLGKVPIGFALDHRIFLHRSTISHDLWSLLAELLYRKLIHAPNIKNMIINGKHNFAMYYLACKAKKRYLVNGNAEIQRLADDFNDRFSKDRPRGDIEDLAQAAAYFDFSYTLIGADSRGNFFWSDRVSTDDESPYLVLFSRTVPDKSTFWYCLIDTGRSCPKEKKLYADVQAGNLREWNGKFYFHYIPRKLKNALDANEEAEASSKKLFSASTKMFTTARDWASTTIGIAQSTVAASYSQRSNQARNIFRRFLDFILNRFTRRVQPDKNVKSLFVRELP